MGSRYVIVLDDPGGDEKPTAEVTRIDTSPELPSVDQFDRWEAGRYPVFMSRLEMGSLRELEGPPAQKAEELIRRYPHVDAWMMHHFNKRDVEATVAEIRARDKMVYRVLDCSDARETGRGEPLGNWNRVRMDAIDKYNIGLRDAHGNHVHYRWYGKGIKLAWDKVWNTPDAMDYLVAGQGFLLAPQQAGGFWQLDVIRTHLSQWELLQGIDSVTRGEHELAPGAKPITQVMLNGEKDKPGLVDQKAYALGANEFSRRIVEGSTPKRRVYWNGEKDTDNLRMWEASNQRGAGSFEDRLGLWSERYGNVLEIRNPGRNDSSAVLESALLGIEEWAANGGFLWPDNSFYVGHPSYPLGEVTPVQQMAIDARNRRHG